MNVFLIRHGETDDNRAAITTGQRDIPLNAAGIIQSMLLATRLKTISCDLVLSSNLSRCLQTTAAVMQYHSCECKALPDLREKSFGVFEGQPYTVYRQALRRSADPERIFTPLGGESFHQLGARIVRFFQHWIAESAKENIVICAHGAVNRALLGTVLGLDFAAQSSIPQGTACLNHLEFADPACPLLKLLNCRSHLPIVTADHSDH